MSPFLAYLSEKTEKIITGNDYPFNLSQFINDVIRGILLALRNFCMEMLISIVFFLCSFFTAAMAAPFVSVILFLVSAYFYGFSFIDYTNERRKLSVSESVRYVRQRKAMSCGHGFVFALLLYVPVLGVALSSFYAIIATVAATIHVLDIEKEQLA
jgi:CysZ protein